VWQKIRIDSARQRPANDPLRFAHVLRLITSGSGFPLDLFSPAFPFPPPPFLSISHPLPTFGTFLGPFLNAISSQPAALHIGANLPYITSPMFHPIKILFNDAQTVRVPKLVHSSSYTALSHDHLHRTCLYSFQLIPIR
jgi:hypothetical protein